MLLLFPTRESEYAFTNGKKNTYRIVLVQHK